MLLSRRTLLLNVLVCYVGRGGRWVWQYLNPITTSVTTNMDNVALVNPESNPSVPGREIVELASGLEVPRGVVCTSDTRCLITERAGRLRLWSGGVLASEPLMVIPEVSSRAEEGLMSIVMSPDYQTTKHLFIAYAYTKGNAMAVRVVRLVDDPRTGITQDRIIMDNLPAARRHAGTALAFGPDGMLYITVGDAIAKDRAQSLVDYHGKTLRVTNEGAIPLDNPFSGSALWTYGHRNSQGIARTSSGLMYASEHGPSTFDGSPGGDEINRIIPGENYGWPLVSHEGIGSGFRAPLAVYTPALAPSSLYIHDGSGFPQWNDHLFVGLLRGEGILVVRIDSSDPDRVVEQFRLVDNRYGRIRFVGAGPAGSILFTTSNEDGRGTSSPHKDKLYQIRPLPLTIRQ